jgi:hypothetical protein
LIMHKYEIRAMHLEWYAHLSKYSTNVDSIYLSLTILLQLIHTYPIFQCREAFEGGDDQGEETIPFCAIDRLDGMCVFFSFSIDACLLSFSVSADLS